MPIVKGADRVLNWINKEKGKFAPLFGVSLENLEIKSLSVENTSVPQNPFDLTRDEAKVIGTENDESDTIWLGYYNEPRLIYTAPAFKKGPMESEQ